VRSRAIARELRNVETLPAPEAARLIGAALDADIVEPGDAGEASATRESRDDG
jgi:hypothetical protein